MLTPQFLDELRARITLSSVIMRTTKLVRAGREWKACCPFHDEKSPSFTVNDDKGFYHCFGCGAHGDAIRWMTDQRGLSFMDAVKELASEASLELPAPDPRAARQAEQRAGLHDVMAAAQAWFVDNLGSEAGAQARAYLTSRGFDGHTIERFGFGFAPDSRTAMAQALSQFDQAMLIEGGLRIQVDGKDPYDRFRDRLMLPIHDARGRVIAFGGRILDKQKTDAPKYLNSPDTPLFDKGRTLYNTHRAGPASRRTERVIAVEGYMDVIALAAAGIDDAVAPMGTALTEQQIELMWRMADKPILCFDGDAAGQRAAMRAIGRVLPLLRPGRSLQFVRLPTGLDPDDLIRQQGVGALNQLLGDPVSLSDMLWDGERDAGPVTAPEDKAGLKARLMAHVDAITDPDIKALYRRDLLDRFSAFAFPRREQRQDARQGGGQERPAFSPRKTGGGGRGNRWAPPERASDTLLRTSERTGSRDMLTQATLLGFAHHADQIPRHAESLMQLAQLQPQLAPAIDRLLDRDETLELQDGIPISGPAFQTPPDNVSFSFLVEGSDPQVAREDLAEAVSLLVERPALDAAIAAATARFDLDPEGAFAEQQRLRKRKLEIESRLGQMARKRAASAPGVNGPSADNGETAEQETE